MDVLTKSDEYDWEQVEGRDAIRPYVEQIIGSKQWREGKADDADQKFFTVRYAEHDLVMPAGVFGEYAALLLRGTVRVVKPGPAPPGKRSEGCWDRPGALSRLWAKGTGKPAHFDERRPGPRRATRDGPAEWVDCHDPVTTKAEPPRRFLGINSAVWNQKRSFTLVAGSGGCDLLLIKRLVLLKTLLRSQDQRFAPLRSHVAERFRDVELPALLARNRLFRRDDDSEKAPDWKGLAARAELIQYFKTEGEFGSPAVPAGASLARVETPKDPSGRLMIWERPEGDAPTRADALYLILSGTVRIARRFEGAELLLRQHDRDGFFGLMADSAEAVTDVHVARLPWAEVEALESQFPSIEARLKKWRRRYAKLDRALRDGSFRVPEEPPEEAATKLLPATDLLRIDTDLCTRCDQCVQACAELHEGTPRFHRANPPLRFGQWEIARACVHCSDAPCQVVCPVGAIAFLDDGIVQIDHDRCIACQRCPSACPFDVIEMYPPDNPDDAPKVPDAKKALGPATKCDRCLTKDYEPACVAACPYGASKRGSALDFFGDLRKWATASDPEDRSASGRRD